MGWITLSVAAQFSSSKVSLKSSGPTGRGYFVTTSRFTDEATESASKSDRIVLVDGDELLRWHTIGSTRK